MPELPEVETIRRDLSHYIEGCTITEVIYDTPSMLKPSPDVVVLALQGQKVRKLHRIAKLLLADIGDVTLAIHLKLNGQLVIRDQKDDPALDRFTHVILKFDNGRELRFNEQRKFGFMKVIHTQEELDVLKSGYGPEPLTAAFTIDTLKKALGKSTRGVKVVLLDQAKIAGLGNIYTDEALWYTKIHPERPANSLTDAELAELYKNINYVIAQGIDDGGTTAADYKRVDGSRGNHDKNLQVFRRDKQPCPRCGTLLQKIRVGGRGTHFCPQCQVLP